MQIMRLHRSQSDHVYNMSYFMPYKVKLVYSLIDFTNYNSHCILPQCHKIVYPSIVSVKDDEKI